MELAHAISSSPVVYRWLTDSSKVPIWRSVVVVETSLKGYLKKMSPVGAADLKSQYGTARCALEEGQWETALSSFWCCRDILKGEEALVGKSSYSLLLLWAEFPLAQMYQLRGSAERSAQMLQKAVETWRELFEGIMPSLMNPDLGLDQKLLSFLYTAEYECGCVNGDSEMKTHAIQKYAVLTEYWSEDDAEPELCLLLSYDHYWNGCFEASLNWIQKANRLSKQILHLASYLRWEVNILMKLKRFKEASSALDGLSSAEVPASEVEERAEEVRRWKQDCDMQMHQNSASDVGDPQELLEGEESRELRYALEQAVEPGHTEAANPMHKIMMDEMMTPDSTSVRRWPSAERSDLDLSHITKLSELPEGPWKGFLRDYIGSFIGAKRKDFGYAITLLNFCRETLRTIKKCIENEAYYSILASVDHLLADLYQFCENDSMCQLDKALEIRKELLICIEHVAPSHKHMKQHYMGLVILTEYQGCSPKDVSREQLVQNYASLMGMKKEQAECDMCFWLLFFDKCFQRKLRGLEDEVMPRWEHSGINHSLPHTHLMRCQVELLLNNVRFLMGGGGKGYDLETVKLHLEKAEGILKDLTQQFEGQSSYEAWIHAMLEDCYLMRSKYVKASGDQEGADGYQEMAEIERALHLTLVEKLGLHQSKKPPSITHNNRSQLIQVEEHIMEQYYWVRFPPAYYLAFRKLYAIARYAKDEGDWDCAIFNFELCRDLLKEMKLQFEKAEFDCSLAWVDLPLVELYEMKMKNLKKSIDLRKEVRDCLGSFEVVGNYVQLAVDVNLHAAMYYFCHSNYPSLMDKIMNEILKLAPKSRAGVPEEMWVFILRFEGLIYWEYHIVSTLIYWHFVQGDYETALDFVGVLKQVVEKHFPKDQEKKDQNVVFEAECLMELKMFEDADLVLQQAKKGKRIDSLSKTIRQTIQMCGHRISGIHAALFETSRNVALYYLRITGAYAQLDTVKRYKGAAYLYTLCIKIIEAAKQDPSNTNERHREANIVSEYRGQPGWYDYFQLGISLRKMFETKMRSNRESFWTHPNSSNVELEGPSLQDTEFSSAMLSFEQQIKLLVNPAFIARTNHEIFKLYGTMDESYFGYLLIKFGYKEAHAMHFDHGIADMNNAKLTEDENHMKTAPCNLTETEKRILEEVEAGMIKYGRRTSLQFANSLYAMKGRYTESWINMLEGHKERCICQITKTLFEQNVFGGSCNTR